MAHPNKRTPAPERRVGHSRENHGRLRFTHRGVDAASERTATAETIDFSNPLCQFDPKCGWLTRAQNVERAMEKHYAKDHGAAA